MCIPGVPTGAILGGAGVGLQAGGAYMAGQSAYQASKFNAAALQNKAALVEQQGHLDAHMLRQRVGQIIGAERAANASKGIATDEGSALSNQMDTARAGELDVLQILHNADLEAAGLNQQAAQEKYQGKGALMAGYFGAGGELLGGLGGLMMKLP